MIKHYQSFFGNKCAVIINSNYETGDFYLNFIMEKKDHQWETYREGLNIKLNLKEICDVADILDKGNNNTRIIHKYQEVQKNFWLGFEKKQTDIVFSIKGRSKELNTGSEIRSHQKSFFKGELRLLIGLWKHIEKEFIEFTTKAKKLD